MTQRMNRELTSFFKRNDNNRMTSRVKDKVTRKKTKKQKKKFAMQP